MKSHKTALIAILLLLFSIPAIFSLLHKGFFLSDDGEWMIIRFSAFHQALVDGQFPVRWLGRLNNGYGYPVADFLYPGFMYIGEPIHILHVGFVDTIKIILGLSMVGSLVFSYNWLRRFFDQTSSVVGSLFYLYTPYHLYDLYKRGSVGELLALAVLPFIFWMIEKKNLIFTSLAISFLILSHNTLALLFLPIISCYMLLRKVPVRFFLLSIFQGLTISAFFWIPALFDLHYTKFSQTQISNWQDHFANISVIGIAAVVLIAGFFIKKRSHEMLFFIILGILAIFISLPISSFVWQILPVAIVQFPFRFLSLLLPSVAFLSAFVLNHVSKNQKYIVAGFMTVLLLISALPFLKPDTLFDKGDAYYATNEDTTNVQKEYMPKWVQISPTQHAAEKVVTNSGKISNLQVKNSKITFSAFMNAYGVIDINTIYFPGWHAYVDGKEAKIEYSNKSGIMEITSPSGEHNIVLAFLETPVRLFADLLSAASLAVLIGTTILLNKRKTKI